MKTKQYTIHKTRQITRRDKRQNKTKGQGKSKDNLAQHNRSQHNIDIGNIR
jgi:hypothetical protein